MNLEDELELEHLLLEDRRCRKCLVTKNLLSDFYKTRKGSGPSSYSYECKECTKNRVLKTRKSKKQIYWEYPDW